MEPVVLGVQVPERAGGELAEGRGAVGRAKQAEPKVRHARVEVFVQQDVGGFDVAVDHGRARVAVQVLQPARGLHRDSHARDPAELLREAVAVEVLEQRSVFHELVHQQALAGVVAVADEVEQVRVVEARQEVDLVVEVLQVVRLLAGCWDGGSLHRDQGVVRQDALVHAREAAAPDLHLLCKPPGRVVKLPVREGPRADLSLQSCDVVRGLHYLRDGSEGALSDAVLLLHRRCFRALGAFRRGFLHLGHFAELPADAEGGHYQQHADDHHGGDKLPDDDRDLDGLRARGLGGIAARTQARGVVATMRAIVDALTICGW